VSRRDENTDTVPRRASAAKNAAAPSRRSRATRPPRLRRLTKWLVGIGLLVTALVFAGQWTLHQSFFRVQHVTFIGLRHEGVVDVLAASGLSSHPSMMGLSDVTIEHNLSRFPWINSVEVTKHWPNSVVVTVHESVAVAVAFSSTHHLYFVDSAGRALGPAAANVNLPTLQYLDPTSSSWPYQRAGRAAAYVAGQLPRAFTTQVSSITDDAKGSVTLHMTTPVTFILGPPTDLHAKFVAIASVIAHSTLVPGDVVDVTVPDELAVTPPS
jgi:cell division protein FtsQ